MKLLFGNDKQFDPRFQNPHMNLLKKRANDERLNTKVYEKDEALLPANPAALRMQRYRLNNKNRDLKI